jgi:hypothetical protein
LLFKVSNAYKSNTESFQNIKQTLAAFDEQDEEEKSTESMHSDDIRLHNMSSKPRSKILTHVIEDFILKECSVPFDELEAEELDEKTNICLECGTACNRNENFCSVDCLREFNKRKRAVNSSVKSKKSKVLQIKLNINKRRKNAEDNSDEKKNNSEQKQQQEIKPSKSSSLDFTCHETLNDKQPQQPAGAVANLPAFQISYSNHHHHPNPSSARPSMSSTSNSSSKQQPTATTIFDFPSGDPAEWSCEQVYAFVRIVAGAFIAETFKAQELDGMSLSLIKDDHLVQTMQIKLGPALKIMSKFNELRRTFAK